MNSLELRKKINAKRPRFRHYDAHKRKEVNPAWRRPRGLHNKMRKGVWGRPATVNVGYRGPADVRGLHVSGLIPVRVFTVNEVAQLNPKTQGVILGKLGGLKKVKVLEAIKKKNVRVFNVKNVDEAIKQVVDKVTKRKAAKKEALQKKKSPEVKPKKESAKEEKPQSDEAAKEQEKKEMDKVLTARE